MQRPAHPSTQHPLESGSQKSKPSKRYSQGPRTEWSDVTGNHGGSCLRCSAPHWPLPSLGTVTLRNSAGHTGSYSGSEFCCSEALLLFPRTGGFSCLSSVPSSRVPRTIRIRRLGPGASGGRCRACPVLGRHPPPFLFGDSEQVTQPRSALASLWNLRRGRVCSGSFGPAAPSTVRARGAHAGAPGPEKLLG